jgi:hypothetical protein
VLILERHLTVTVLNTSVCRMAPILIYIKLYYVKSRMTKFEGNRPSTQGDVAVPRIPTHLPSRNTYPPPGNAPHPARTSSPADSSIVIPFKYSNLSICRQVAWPAPARRLLGGQFTAKGRIFRAPTSDEIDNF